MNIKTYVASPNGALKIPVWLVKLFFTIVSLSFYLIGACKAIKLAGNEKREYAALIFLTFVVMGVLINWLKKNLTKNNLLIANKGVNKSERITQEEYEALVTLQLQESWKDIDALKEARENKEKEEKERALKSLEEKIEKIS